MESHGRERPRAIFMAFGTKGDVLPLAAIASTFASSQRHYHVSFITHAAHEYLMSHMAAADISLCAISTPPVLPFQYNSDEAQKGDMQEFSPQFKRQVLEHQHRKECVAAVENIFGEGPEVKGDFIVINFFALEGWHLAELFQVPCVVAAPYVVPYSAPSSFERRFKIAHPLLYKQLKEDFPEKVCWRDVIHWMWPLFTECWASWRKDCLHLSSCPLTDPVTELPVLHCWPKSPLLLYGFSKEVVECPDYWPPNVHICGFWFPPAEWEFIRHNSSDEASADQATVNSLRLCQCPNISATLCQFLSENSSDSCRPLFLGLSSIGSMGYIENPKGMLLILKKVLEGTSYKVILLTAGHPPLDSALKAFAGELLDTDILPDPSANDCHYTSELIKDGVMLFSNRLLSYASSIPYSWIFPKCSVAIHHGGSGSTAAALRAGIPQIICPFTMDQFYWAERMSWLGVAPPPLKRSSLIPNNDDDSIMEAANVLLDAIEMAMNVEMRARAAHLAEKICSEDGVGNAVNLLVKEVCGV